MRKSIHFDQQVKKLILSSNVFSDYKIAVYILNELPNYLSYIFSTGNYKNSLVTDIY